MLGLGQLNPANPAANVTTDPNAGSLDPWIPGWTWTDYCDSWIGKSITVLLRDSIRERNSRLRER